MIDFYGSPQSSAGRTHWMLEEVGVPYEYHRIDLHDAEQRAAYRAINPSGRVPFLVDGELRMAESAAINLYLAERYKPEMWGWTAAERAKIYEWTLWGMTNLLSDALAVMQAALRQERTREAPIEAARRCQRLLDQLETGLADGYLVGRRFTVADVNAGSTVNLALRAQAAEPGPRTRAWIDSLRARPAYERAARQE